MTTTGIVSAAVATAILVCCANPLRADASQHQSRIKQLLTKDEPGGYGYGAPLGGFTYGGGFHAGRLSTNGGMWGSSAPASSDSSSGISIGISKSSRIGIPKHSTS